MSFYKYCLLTLIILTQFSSSYGNEKTEQENIDKFIKEFWYTAKQHNISLKTYQLSMQGVKFNEEVQKRDQNQPEFKMSAKKYIKLVVTKNRFINGKKKIKEYYKTFNNIENKFDINKAFISAIWGIESSFGQAITKKANLNNVFESLVNLAVGKRRKKFAISQLISALTIVEKKYAKKSEMVGSWAGAMGHTQFIPSSYLLYAVDFDHDGWENIWTSVPDALATAANLLMKNGWEKGRTWGYEVRIPSSSNWIKKHNDKTLSIQDWINQGVIRTHCRKFPFPTDKARLYMPSGTEGPIFLTIHNFKVLKKYNNSDYYALAVGLLADKINGYRKLALPWPQ